MEIEQIQQGGSLCSAFLSSNLCWIIALLIDVFVGLLMPSRKMMGWRDDQAVVASFQILYSSSFIICGPA